MEGKRRIYNEGVRARRSAWCQRQRGAIHVGPGRDRVARLASSSSAHQPAEDVSASAFRRGISTIWVVVSTLALIAIVGLALDTAYGLLVGHQLQIAADAASMAGARVVRADIDQARVAAQALGLANAAGGDPVQLALNGDNATDGDIVVGRYFRQQHMFDSTNPDVNAVKIAARRGSGSLNEPVNLLFGPAFGQDSVNVGREAIAIVAGTTGGGLITLCPDCECSLEFSGNTELVLEAAPGWDGDTAIQVNSADPCAVCGNGSALTVQAPETNVVGDACWDGNPTLDTYINPDSPAMPDPLAGLPAPTWGAPQVPDTINATTIQQYGNTFGPGHYPGGIRITSAGTYLTLLPGIYVVDGEGLYVNGGNLDAYEVMFYVIGTGRVYLGGNGHINITPSSDEGDPYWGISIFQARDNTNEATIIGTSNMNLQGTYYFPAAPVEIGGEGISIGNQLIAWTMWIHGRGTFTVQYDGRFPAPGAKVFLVE